MNDEIQTEGAATVAGGLVIPDISALSTQQNQNMQQMTSAIEAASQGLQAIVTQQQKTLQETVEKLRVSITASDRTTHAKIDALSENQALISNLSACIEGMNTTAGTLTSSTTKSFDAINQSLTASLAAIEQVAKKFSSGG
jgi:septal ring factor EnvC (AmiA/AmiB activator)